MRPSTCPCLSLVDKAGHEDKDLSESELTKVSNIRWFPPLKRETTLSAIMPESKMKVNVKKFKEWVSANLSAHSPLSQVMQREKDELPIEEALAKTGMICALIDTSVNSETLLNRAKTR